MLEITAARDDASPSANLPSSTFGNVSWKPAAAKPFYRKKSFSTKKESDSPGSLFSLVPSDQRHQSATSTAALASRAPVDSAPEASREIDELKSMIRSLSEEVSRLKPSVAAPVNRQAVRSQDAGEKATWASCLKRRL